MCLIVPDGGDAQIVSDDFLLSAKSPFSSHLIKVKATGKYDTAFYSAREAKMCHASSLVEGWRDYRWGVGKSDRAL